MRSRPVAALRAEGLEKLDGQGGAVALSAEHCEWLEGLGVRLYQASGALKGGAGHVWGPAWLNALGEVYHGRGNVYATAVARCARSPVWAEAMVAAARLGGKKAVDALVKLDDLPEPAPDEGEPPEVLLGCYTP